MRHRLKNWYTFFTADTLILLAIIVLAALPRLYNLSELMPFIPDQGRDYLAAREILHTGKWPLLGIASSVPRFHQGPVYVWFTAVALAVGNFDPVAPAFMASALGILAVGGVYLLLNEYVSREQAFYAALILATSPFAIMQSRLAFHTNAIPLVSVIYLWWLLRFIKSGKGAFGLTFFWALVFQFELVVAPIILLIPLAFWLQKKWPNRNQSLWMVLGLVLGLAPQIIYDLTHGFAQLGVFAVWIAYRLGSFVGLDPEHTASADKLSRVVQSVFEYTQKFFSWPMSAPSMAIVALIINRQRQLRSLRNNPLETLVLAWSGLMLLAFIVMGNASEAYFPVLFVPACILTASAIVYVCPRWVKKALVTGLIFVSAYNLYFLSNHSWLMHTGQTLTTNPFGTYGPPLKDQITAMNYLSAFNTPIHLRTTAANAAHDSYLDSYRYLAYWLEIPLKDTGMPVWINYGPGASVTNTKSVSFGALTISTPIAYD